PAGPTLPLTTIPPYPPPCTAFSVGRYPPSSPLSWRVTEDEYEKAVTLFNKLKSKDPLDTNSPQTARNQFINIIRANEKSMAHPPYDDKYSDFVVMRNENAVIERYRIQNTTPYFPVELHVMRLGDIAFATNPFELFVDYGLSIKGRSKAEQTFVIQLSGDEGGYLPTEKAVQGGGYGGMVVNGKVGPAGGKILVQETIECINAIWK
ncbi:MAG: hypothetical protein M1426_00630, partial [Patescibacteria group bacterium]|nr:hypothetical protein [Patescibacteria group bacterium]